MTQRHACPDCGADLASEAPSGRCPKCRVRGPSSATATYRPGTGPERAGASVDVPEFRRMALEIGLVDPEDLDLFAAGALGDAARLAQALVRAGKLTPYQAGAILQGKARGLVVGDYVVLDKLGRGGMGVVFKARQKSTAQIVAVKVLPPSFGRDREAVERFRREFEVAARLHHPNVVAAIEANGDRNVQFLAMEYIDGHDLDVLVTEVGPLPIKLALQCAIQAARGLEAAHALGIIHRDVKPANLILDRSGTVRVLDLGLARVIEAANPFGGQEAGSLTRTGSYMGTVDFIAPEQADDSKRADHRADVYSLGCTLYFLLTGHPPFSGDSVLKRLLAHQERPAPSLLAARDGVPAAVESVYQKMMAKRPGDRPQSMSAVAQALEACRSSTDEAKEARAGLKGFAETVMKRASPKKRRGLDATVFARPGNSRGTPENPDLSLEDLVGDYRDEARARTLSEDELPPMLPRLRSTSKSSRRTPALFGLGAAGVVGLLIVGVLFFPRRAPESLPLPTVVRVKPVAIEAVTGLQAFAPLWNGRDLAGWQPIGCKATDWPLQEGALAGVMKGGDSRDGWLATVGEFADFDLILEFQMLPGSNSGVFLRAPADTYPGLGNGLEIQLVDESAPTYRNLAADVRTGAIHGVKGPENVSLNSVGMWNTLEVRAQGPDVRVRINSVTVLEDSLNDHLELASQRPGLLRRSGRIGLQRHTGTVRFRKIYARALAPYSGSTESLVAGPARMLHSDDFSDEKSGWPRESATDLAKNSNHHWGYQDGVYRLDANEPGGYSWDCPRYQLPEFSCAVVGRVFGDRPTSMGGWGVMVERNGRAFQVRIDGQGALFFEPSFRYKDKHPTDPRLGPITHPAIKPAGKGFNAVTLRVKAREVEVLVNGSLVCGPVRLDYDVIPATLQLGVLCEAPGVRAEFDKIEIKELAPKRTQPDLARGDELRESKKFLEAAAAYREAIRHRPGLEPAHRGLVAALKELGDVDGSIEARRALLVASSDIGNGYADLALELRQLGRKAEAVAAAREAVRIRPFSNYPWNALGIVLMDQREYAGAAVAFRAAVERKPTLLQHRVDLAKALGAQGNREEAAAVGREIVRLGPNDATILNNLAWSLVMVADPAQRQTAEALTLSRRSVAIYPKSVAFQGTLATVEYFAGDLTAASSTLETVKKLNGGDDGPYEWFLKAMIFHRNGDRDQARAWFDKSVSWARSNAPHDPDLRILWGESATLLGLPAPDTAATPRPAS